MVKIVEQTQSGTYYSSHRLNMDYTPDIVNRFIRTRLYFTSESHIISFINLLKFGKLSDDEEWAKSLGNRQKISKITRKKYYFHKYF